LAKKNIYLITPNTLDKSFYYFLPKLLKLNRIAFLQIRLKKISRTKLIEEVKKIKKIVGKKQKLLLMIFQILHIITV
jgi:Thiamine monophosphate synthase/TENI.